MLSAPPAPTFSRILNRSPFPSSPDPLPDHQSCQTQPVSFMSSTLPVFATLTIASLPPERPDAGNALRIAAYCHGVGIPWSVLNPMDAKPGQAPVWQVLEEHALAQLDHRSQTLTLAEPIQAAVRNALSPQDQRQSWEAAIERVGTLFPNATIGYRESAELLLPHVATLMRHGVRWTRWPAATEETRARAVKYLIGRGRHREAREFGADLPWVGKETWAAIP